jgi:hypothetical protein
VDKRNHLNYHAFNQLYVFLDWYYVDLKKFKPEKLIKHFSLPFLPSTISSALGGWVLPGCRKRPG